MFDFHMPSFWKYFKNTSWMMLEKVIRAIALLFVGVYIARYLGPSNYGLLSYCISLVMLFSVFSSLGLDNILIRELVKSPEMKESLLGTTFTLRLFSSFIVICVIYTFLTFTSSDLTTNIMVIIISCGLIFQSFNVIEFYFQSKVLAHYVVPIQMIQVLLSSALKIILVVFNASILSFAIVALCDSIFMALGLICISFKYKLRPLEWTFSLNLAKKLIKDSMPLIFSGLFVSIYLRIDQVMIKHLLNSVEVGYYAIAVNLCEIWYFLPLVICASLFPALIEAKKINLKHYHSRLQKMYDLMVILSLLIAIPVTIWGQSIITIFFGGEYGNSTPVLRIYIWANLFVFLGVASGKWLINENLNYISFYRTLSGAVINIILNIIMIPKYGIIGAAVATLISQFLAAYAFDLFNKKTFISFKMKSRSLFLYNYIFPSKL